MNQQEMFGAAKWIGCDGVTKTPVIRADFDAKNAVRAEITICGLGYFALYVNGKRVSDDLFVPATSDYAPRNIPDGGKPFDEEFHHRCYCLRYDLTEYLQTGRNALGVALGSGFFAQEIWSFQNTMVSYGEARLCYRVTLTDADGNSWDIVSGKDAKWKQGIVERCDFFRGERHNMNLCGDVWMTEPYDAWADVAILPDMETSYQYQDCPADRIIRAIKPTLLSENARGRLYDLGENITGWVFLRDRAKKNAEIEVRFCEMLDARGMAEKHYMHDQKWTIVSDGRGRLLHPEFTWYGFRYFVVQGDAEVVCAAVIHADLPVSSYFHSASPVLNWLYTAYVRTQLDNFHGGIPSDCPHLERRGYTGDGQLTCESAVLALNHQTTLRKWMRDIQDCQDIHSGHVQNTAPYTRCGGGPGGWGSAIITVPLVYYRQYADAQPLADMYEGMERYLEYLRSHSEDDLVVSDRPGEWCLGDWCTPDPIRLPPPYVNTYFLAKSLLNMMEIDKILGKPARPEWRELYDAACRAIVKHYYNPETHDFAEGIQGANAFALDIGLGDAQTLANFFARYEALGQYDTGIFGTELVTRLLAEKGRPDLAYALLAGDKPTSFGEMMRMGATTLWEYWANCEYQRSLNHPMFGAASKELFHYALGMRQEQGGSGWKHARIEPAFTEQLPQAEGYITTPLGRLAVAYDIKMLYTDVVVEIPEGMEAVFVWDGMETTLHTGKNALRYDGGMMR